MTDTKTRAIISGYVLILSLCGLATEKMSAQSIHVLIPDAIYASVPFEIVFVFRGGEMNWSLPKEITVVKEDYGPSGYVDRYYSYFVKVDRKGNYTLPCAELCDYATGSVLCKTDPIEITVQDAIPIKIKADEIFHRARKYGLRLMESVGQLNDKKSFTYSEYETSEYTEWGETKEKKNLISEGIVLNGQPVLQCELIKNPKYYDNDIYYGEVAKYFVYDKGLSKISEIRYYWRPLLKEEAEFELFNIETFNYDSESRLSSITFNRCHPPKHFWDDDDHSIADPEHACQKEYRNHQLRWVYKILYKYHKDDRGYDVFGCGPGGATHFHNEVSADNRLVTTKSGQFNECWNLDADGKIISYGSGAVACDGAIDYSQYYSYNSHGDLVADSPNVVVVRNDNDYPWLTESYKYNVGTYYEYIYDENGNWVRKTIYRLSNLKAPQETKMVRDIRYEDIRSTLFDIGNDYADKAADCENQIAALTNEIKKLENIINNGGSASKTNQIKLNKLNAKIKNLELEANAYRMDSIVHLERAYKLYSDKQDAQVIIAKLLTSVLYNLREKSDFYMTKYEYYSKVLLDKQ